MEGRIMARTKHQDKHLWKNKETAVWYYQRTYKKRRYKFSLETKDINQARKLRDTYDLMLAVDGTIIRQSDEHFEVPLFGQVCMDWYEIKKLDCRHDTVVDGYKPKLNAHILKAPFVNKAIDTIEPEDIEDWWHTISCKGSTINVILDIMSNIYRFAMKKKWVDLNPVKLIDRPKRNSDLPDSFDLDDTKILIKNIGDHYCDYQIVRFFAGMRASEQNALDRSEHINLANRIIKVRRSLVGGKFGPPKNQWSKRDIRMNEITYQAIRRQIKRALKQGSQTLFFNKQGNPINFRSYDSHVWKPLFEKEGVKNTVRYRNCKCSRHTYISLSLATGENPMFVAKQVGHRDARTIFKNYAAYIKNDHDGSKLDRELTHNLHNLAFGEGFEKSNPLKS
jgi:integrase